MKEASKLLGVHTGLFRSGINKVRSGVLERLVVWGSTECGIKRILGMCSHEYEKVVGGARKSYTILSYKVKHDYDVSEFLSSYRYLLQRAIDIIWGNIEWRKKGERLILLIPRSREFRQGLRDCLLENWDYASHYVDSAIKTAYSILNSWRRNYLKGKRSRSKLIVRREFVRFKETLYVYKNERIRVTIKPRELTWSLIYREPGSNGG